MDNVRENVTLLFGFQGKGLKQFKKDTYKPAFKEFMQGAKPFFDSVDSMLPENLSSGEYSEICENIAGFFIEYVQSIRDKFKSKSGKADVQRDMNLYMVTYVFPGILSQRGDWSDLLCQKIEEQWAIDFPDSNIHAASFEEIQSGFKTKLCYVTTAVCESLGKGPDCRELELLKNYRDTYLAEKENGELLIQEYYDIAPTIVKRINRSEDPQQIYSQIWNDYIYTCIQCIENNELEQCEKVYTDMVDTLFQKYMENTYEH